MKLDLDGLDGLLHGGGDVRKPATLPGLGGPTLFPVASDEARSRGVAPLSLPPPLPPPPRVVPPSSSVFADDQAPTLVRPRPRRRRRLVWPALAAAALLALFVLWPRREPPALARAEARPAASPALGSVLQAPAALETIAPPPIGEAEALVAPLRFRVAGARPDEVDPAGVRRFAAELESRCEGRRIVLTGHTCNKGTAKQNLRLGRQRARHARALLVAAGLVAPITLRTAGSRAPLVSNASEAGRQQNRRVSATCSHDPSSKR